MLRIACAAALLALPCPGQTTYVVDQHRAPGYHFADLPDAVAQVVDGDRILVRSGTYSPFTLTRGVTILGQSGVRIRNSLTVVTLANLGAGRTISMHNLEVAGVVFIRGCRGRVILDQIRSTSMTVVDCDPVRVDHSVCSRIDISTSRVAASECRFGDGASGIGATLQKSAATFAGCDVAGGVFLTTGRPAIALSTGSILTLTDNGSRSVRVGPNAPPGTPAITGTGILVLDPRVQLLGTSPTAVVAPSVTLLRRVVPYLRATLVPNRGPVQVTLAAEAGQPFYLAVGLPGPVVDYPALRGAIWMDLRTMVLVAAGSLDRFGLYNKFVAAPGSANLLGHSFVWQGSAGPTLSQQSLSNPVTYVHGQ